MMLPSRHEVTRSHEPNPANVENILRAHTIEENVNTAQNNTVGTLLIGFIVFVIGITKFMPNIHLDFEQEKKK